MVTVVRWTGQEARILRDALHMSVRDFSNHTGLSVSAIADMEAKGAGAKLRQATQRILDTTLERAPDQVRRRFEAILAAAEPAASPAESGEAVPAVDQLAEGSAQRSRSLVSTLRVGAGSRLRYQPPAGVVEIAAEFLRSPSRVFVVTGVPGCGKTQLVQYLAAELADYADVQLHAIDVLGDGQPDLPVEILRYASIPTDGDALLTLERRSERLHRPCLVILDCVKGQQELNAIGRQLDVIVRQVMSPQLRFLLVIRTPPDVDVSAYPVLAASIYSPAGVTPQVSHHLVPWTAAEAVRAWQLSRGPGEPSFLDLPLPVQQLARLPLYMELIKTAGHDAATGDVDAYHLVDHCVSSIIRASGGNLKGVAVALSDLAASQAGELVPKTLILDEAVVDGSPPRTLTIRLPLLRVAPDGGVTFSHDVLREYFLASRISDLVVQRGRSLATVAALNELAAHAATAATARGVFDFVVSRLAQHASDLLAALVLSPTISANLTLPMVIDSVGGRLGPEVLRACVRRCVPEGVVGLSKSLIATPLVAAALGEDYEAWILELLRAFGFAVWTEITMCVERSMDSEQVARLLAAANLDDADEATFFARHFFVFVSSDHDPADLLDTLLTHPDWRVRAALAEGIGDVRARSNRAHGPILERLIADADYKVRAAVGRAAGGLDPAVTTHQLRTLLADENWHVRGCTLESLASRDAESDRQRGPDPTAIQALTDDQSWRGCPGHIATLLNRLLLLHDVPSPDERPPAQERALFALLREQRTGAVRLPATVLRSLTDRAIGSESWLVRREVEALLRGVREPSGPSSSEAYRRLREGRSVQVALDLQDLDHAVVVARAAAGAGADFVEVGDPLIKHVGLHAVERIKREVPDVAVVAEMMSADWGRDQVAMAAEAGADVVLLIGPATSANVAAAAGAGRRLGVPVVLDIPAFHASPQWVRDMERVGVDGFSITTNIDLGVAGRHPLAKARIVRSWTRLPVAVSGGFGPTDYALASSRDWDVLIVGRSIVEAVQPDVAVKNFIDVARGKGRAANS
ncbi:HEAT repeat domain-containing protein [Micromonospora sp. CPCC 205371]|nr:HEAT repeat domain-containing protein [Micromonospora sp. CPCC 205371]